jgi:dolichyl-phosphate beta-glucosyltransferase
MTAHSRLISVVIAAYNEEKRLPESLRRISTYLAGKKLDYEIIVVDDGSNDRTAAMVEAMSANIPSLHCMSYPHNRGKGYALRTGVLATKGDVVLVSDADLSTPIEELEVLWPILAAGRCEVAIGSRALGLSRIIKKQPWWRQGMGKAFNRVVRLLVVDDFSDTQCGFKLFAGSVARKLFTEACVDRFAYDVEILALAKKNGFRIAEIPIKWINAPGSKVHPIVDSLQMVKDLIKIRLRVGSLKNCPQPCCPEASTEP